MDQGQPQKFFMKKDVRGRGAPTVIKLDPPDLGMDHSIIFGSFKNHSTSPRCPVQKIPEKTTSNSLGSIEDEKVQSAKCRVFASEIAPKIFENVTENF